MRFRAHRATVLAAQGSLQPVQQQYTLGAASYVQQAQRLTDSAALFQTLGAGWAGVESQ